MKRQRDYFYLPLVDAIKSIGVKVNLFALLEQISEPSITSSSDNVLKLKVVDPTFPALGVTVMFSADTKTNLPNVNSAGDIISLHRVTMSGKYNATDHDTAQLEHMREWSRERMRYEVFTDHPLKLMRMNPCAIFDLVCKVLHVSRTSSNQPVLYVWDGTDAPPGLQFIT